MNVQPTNADAYKLLHDGSIALANVEANGMKIDPIFIRETIRTVDKKINRLEKKLDRTNEVKEWKKKYRTKFKLGSATQLGDMLFNELGFKPTTYTDSGAYAMTEEALEDIKSNFTEIYFKRKKYLKARDTYLKNLLIEEVDGIVHPFFNLHTTSTYRSSSSAPNFQNMPIRNPEIGGMIRGAIVPRKDHHIIEIDYGGLEVKIATCYHKDPAMIEELFNDELDMHRDMAMAAYMLSIPHMTPINESKEESSRIKAIRFSGKSNFVFPEFYGDFYPRCARAMWETIDRDNLCLANGTNLKDHLFEKGITKLGKCNPKDRPQKGTFEAHLKKVEKIFWEERFPVYNQWKQNFYELYKGLGYIESYTGFTYSGYMRKNVVINAPIQGSAFHCLLWSVIKMNNWLVKNKMKTKIIGQIHDSIVADVHKDEKDIYLQKAKQVMTEDIRKYWDWIIVPLEIEAEVAPLGLSWKDKKEVKI